LSTGSECSVSLPLAVQASGLWLLPWHNNLLAERIRFYSGRTAMVLVVPVRDPKQALPAPIGRGAIGGSA